MDGKMTTGSVEEGRTVGSAAEEALRQIMAASSPAYLFDLDQFADRCAKAQELLGEIPLTYSMKANPFLLNGLPDWVSHVEVCSPGELQICKYMKIAPERIIYSGVMKEQCDVEDAVSYGVDILTAESLLHARLESDAVVKFRKTPEEKRKVLLRLTNGSQFGMSAADIESIIGHPEEYPGLAIYGIHYFSGTQKKLRQVKKDVERITSLLADLKEKYGFEPQLVEYGPGASADYFEAPYDETELEQFGDVMEEIRTLAEQYPVGVEMGRFLASGCGQYVTRICDQKCNNDTNYLICDGGIHHLKYYGQNMAMQVPPIRVYAPDGRCKGAAEDPSEGSVPYMICGSLCTMADILVREAELPETGIGEYLVFGRCGAYSVTEGSYLFLSRTLPRIYTVSEAEGLQLLREHIPAYELNMKE